VFWDEGPAGGHDPRVRIRATGSLWRKLPAGRQAVIVLAVPRHDQRLCDMAGVTASPVGLAYSICIS
jgi:hypothetical protein